jgi:hypothetical protein
VEKVKSLEFLVSDQVSLGQAAIRWLLAEPLVVSALPNVYDGEQLAEFAAASGMPPLSSADLARIEALDADNFGVAGEEPMKYKGAMTRDGGANLDLMDARNPISRPALPANRGAAC